MMQKNDKDLWELDRDTYKAVADKIKTKNKSVFNYICSSIEHVQHIKRQFFG